MFFYILLGKFVILGRHFVKLGIFTMSSLYVLLHWWKFRHIGCFLQAIGLYVMPSSTYALHPLSYVVQKLYYYPRYFSALHSVSQYFGHRAFQMEHAHIEPLQPLSCEKWWPVVLSL